MNCHVRRFYKNNSVLILVVIFLIFTCLTPSVIPQWDGVGPNIVGKMLSSNVGKRSPTISESTVTNAENVMSNLLVNNDKNVGHTNLRGEESHRFLQVKKNSFIGAKNLFSGFLKKMFQKRKKGRYPSPSGKSCYRCDLTANTLNYVPEHHCLDPSYCGCDEMAGSDCEMAKRGARKS